MKATVIILLLALLALAAMTVWQRGRFRPEETSMTDATTGQSSSVLRGPLALEIVSDTWFNSPALTSADLRGKVVLVEFWTFGCFNCRNVLPSLKSWHDKYRDQGLVVVSIHSPEFTYEHDVANVRRAITDLSIPYPVALDNDFKIWKSYNVRAWPTWFVLDKQGTIRYSHVGEGAYAETEQMIRALLKEQS
ncbi:MAG: redoxin domain-containing protein [Chloroflexi bacterium]|nr:redoxin domain-containing protein [Chloroflexota bacterium]